MSLHTQAVISGHLSVEDICRRLREGYGARNVVARPGRHSDYWIVEFVDHGHELRVVHAFLNSWAAEDYAELCAGDSTFVTTECSPSSMRLAEAIVGTTKGWRRWAEADRWERVIWPE